MHTYTHTNTSVQKHTHKYHRKKNLCSISSLPLFSVVEEGETDALILGSTLVDKGDAVTDIMIDGDGTGTDDRANDDDIDGTGDADSDVDDSDDGDDGNDAGAVGRSSVAIIEHMLIK